MLLLATILLAEANAGRIKEWPEEEWPEEEWPEEEPEPPSEIDVMREYCIDFLEHHPFSAKTGSKKSR